MGEKKRDGWFFTKSILNEINELPDEHFSSDPLQESQKKKTKETGKRAVSGKKEQPSVKTSVTESELERQVLERELKNLRRDVQKMKEEAKHTPTVSLDTLAQTQQEYEEKLTKLKEANKVLEEQVGNYKKRESQLSNELKEAQTAHDSMKNASKLEKGRMATLDQATKELTEVQAALAKTKQLVGEKEKKVAESQEQFEAMHDQYKQLERQFQAAQQETLLQEQANKLLSYEKEDTEGVSTDTQQLSRKVAELLADKHALTEELNQAKQRIGEVLIAAKKQANQFVSEAKVEASQVIHSARKEAEEITGQARKISSEIKHSHQTVTELYHVLQKTVDELLESEETNKNETA